MVFKILIVILLFYINIKQQVVNLSIERVFASDTRLSTY